MRISDWSSDVCSSHLDQAHVVIERQPGSGAVAGPQREAVPADAAGIAGDRALRHEDAARQAGAAGGILDVAGFVAGDGPEVAALGRQTVDVLRGPVHTAAGRRTA